jgi:hypothetical protein
MKNILLFIALVAPFSMFASGPGVATGILDAVPQVFLLPVEETKAYEPLGPDISLVPTQLKVKMRYRAVMEGNKTQVFDVEVPVWYNDRHLLLDPEEQRLLLQYAGELEQILLEMELLQARAEQLSKGLSDVYARGRPLSLLAPDYRPVVSGLSSSKPLSKGQIPLITR